MQWPSATAYRWSNKPKTIADGWCIVHTIVRPSCANCFKSKTTCVDVELSKPLQSQQFKHIEYSVSFCLGWVGWLERVDNRIELQLCSLTSCVCVHCIYKMFTCVLKFESGLTWSAHRKTLRADYRPILMRLRDVSSGRPIRDRFLCVVPRTVQWLPEFVGSANRKSGWMAKYSPRFPEGHFLPSIVFRAGSGDCRFSDSQRIALPPTRLCTSAAHDPAWCKRPVVETISSLVSVHLSSHVRFPYSFCEMKSKFWLITIETAKYWMKPFRNQTNYASNNTLGFSFIDCKQRVAMRNYGRTIFDFPCFRLERKVLFIQMFSLHSDWPLSMNIEEHMCECAPIRPNRETQRLHKALNSAAFNRLGISTMFVCSTEPIWLWQPGMFSRAQPVWRIFGPFIRFEKDWTHLRVFSGGNYVLLLLIRASHYYQSAEWLVTLRTFRHFWYAYAKLSLYRCANTEQTIPISNWISVGIISRDLPA